MRITTAEFIGPLSFQNGTVTATNVAGELNCTAVQLERNLTNAPVSLVSTTEDYWK